MPSAKHETPIALIRESPDLLAWLLRDMFDVQIPDFGQARPHAADVQIMQPSTLHADAIVVFTDTNDRPVFAAILEVQLRWDAGKLRTWPTYLAHLEAELNLDAALVVYCPKASVAERYRHQIADGGLSLKLDPFFLTPEHLPLITDTEAGKKHPARTVLAALANSDSTHVQDAFPALGAALANVGDTRSVSYYDIVAAGLPPAVSQDWRTYMTSTVKHRFLSDHLRTLEAEAIERGLERGLEQGLEQGRRQEAAEAVLAVLAARSFTVPARAKKKIRSTTDLQVLNTWLQKAATATSIDDVLTDTPTR